MAKPLTMHQIKRIIEFQFQDKSTRKIARLTGLSRDTISKYVQRIKDSGLTQEELLVLKNEDLVSLVYTESIEKGTSGRSVDSRHEILVSRLHEYQQELLKNRHLTRQLLWEEYRKEYPDGYGYTQFCEHLKRYEIQKEAVMYFKHVPGEQMQVDFAGDKLGYVDIRTGEWVWCEVLLAVFPYSHYLYVEALRSQKQEDFIHGLANAFIFFGGVPLSVKLDNMRTAVSKANRYEPTFTEAMEFLAQHYETTMLTARVRKPRDKGSVENGVGLAYKRIYAVLRKERFHSMEELNRALRAQLEQLNSRPFQKKDGCRKQMFEAHEKPLLKPLPTTRYQIKHVTYGKVQRNYHIIVGEDRHQYSVPYRLIGKRLKAVYTTDTVEIYDNLDRVAIHRRSYQKNAYTTAMEHRPPNHQAVVEYEVWDDEYFLREASYRGQAVHAVVKRINL
jgi:transposase